MYYMVDIFVTICQMTYWEIGRLPEIQIYLFSILMGLQWHD